MRENPPARNSFIESSLPIVAASLLFLGGACVACWAFWRFDSAHLEAYATFTAGTVAPLWSAAGLLLLYAAYAAQKSQITLQSEQIRKSAIEMQRSRIESRFYELLRLHNSQVANLESPAQLNDGQILPLRGKRCLHSYYVDITAEYKTAYRRWKGMIGQDPTRFREILEVVERSRPGSIQGYYVSVAALLKMLDKAAAFEAELAGDLAEVLVAQFAYYELSLLYLKFYSDARFAKVLDLARKHQLFRNHEERTIWNEFEQLGEQAAT